MARNPEGVRQRYALLLLAILLSYTIAIVTAESQLGFSVLILAQLATLWLALRVSEADRLTRIAGIGILVMAVVLAGTVVVGATYGFLSDMNKWWFVIATAMYLVAPFAIMRHLVQRRETDRETLYGAIAAYLMIGMSFAFVFRNLGAWQSTPFFGTGGVGTMAEDLFFSFTSLTTVGYGNLVPAGNPGQTLAVFEAVLGQLFLVVVVARVVTNLTASSAGDTGNPVDTSDPAAPADPVGTVDTNDGGRV